MSKDPMKIYRLVNDQVIALLKKDIIPWKMPLSFQTPHQNYFTKTIYSGVNSLILNGMTKLKGFKSPYWATFNQLKILNASIKEKEKATRIIYYKTNKNKKGESYNILRFLSVFNLDQVEGIPRQPQQKTFNEFLKTSHIIDSFINGPEILIGEENIYCLVDDFIEIQDKTNFIELSKLLIKSTGHIDRLNRISSNYDIDHPLYILEELVIDIGSCFLCSLVGIKPEPLTDLKDYRKRMILLLEESPNLIFNAASMASRAVKYIFKKEKVIERNN